MRTYQIEMVVVVYDEADSEEDARIKAGPQAAKEIETDGVITNVATEEEPKGLEAMIEHGFVSDEPDTEEQA